MANIGTWRAPLPKRIGGKSHDRVTRIFDRIRAALGKYALSNDMDAINVADDIAASRLLSIADRAIDRRLAQWDPRKATTRLESWEEILAIVPNQNDSLATRQRRAASRLLSEVTSPSEGIARAVKEAFDPWVVHVRLFDKAHATMYWPPANPTMWYSTIAHVCAEYVRPMGASDSDAQARIDACSFALDERLPATSTFSISETLEGNDFYFYADISRADYTCCGYE